MLDAATDWAGAFRRFEQERRPHTDAIADMAIENYLEMRDTVRDPQFHLQKALSLELERRFPRRFVPRYSMVMFHDEIPYAVALERGRIQNKILAQLTRNVEHARRDRLPGRAAPDRGTAGADRPVDAANQRLCCPRRAGLCLGAAHCRAQ